MKQFVIIGLSGFGKRMLEELIQTDVELLIIDKDRETIEQYKNQVHASYIADVINEETIRKIVPDNITAVIIDLGDNIEASILVTNYLQKMGVKDIIAKAETDQHGEILKIVGATQVVFPSREAAKRITPPLVSSDLFNYLPISKGLVIAEVRLPQKFAGKSLIEANLRKNFNLNVIAITKESEDGEYDFFSPDYQLQAGDILLVVGKELDISKFSGTVVAANSRRGLGSLFKRFFSRG